MSPRAYLPSAQFMVLVGALALSGGAVMAARYIVSPHGTPSSLSAASSVITEQNRAWQQSLEEIQANSGATLPEAPSGDAIQNLLTQAQSSNLTDSIGRSLLVKLTSAGVQGLGDDIPTQDSIIAEAAAQINASQISFKAVTLTTVPATDITLRAYGNAVMGILAQHPDANSNDTLLAIAKATDTRNPTALAALARIGQQYKATADQLAAIEVPKTLSPLHVQVVQNLYGVAGTYADMELAVEDPLRSITGLQKYQMLLGEAARVFINIADSLKKSGILFSKDEPGSAWETLLPAS